MKVDQNVDHSPQNSESITCNSEEAEEQLNNIKIKKEYDLIDGVEYISEITIKPGSMESILYQKPNQYDVYSKSLEQKPDLVAGTHAQTGKTPTKRGYKQHKCNRYLATGIQFRQLAFTFRISKTAISTIIPEVCKAIWATLLTKYISEPSEDDLNKIAQCFWDRWQFPNCLGSIDEKHIIIKKPNKSGSMYYNYKSFFSIGLLAATDANYKFVLVNVGSYGKENDAGVHDECPFKCAIDSGRLKVLEEELLPGSNIKILMSS